MQPLHTPGAVGVTVLAEAVVTLLGAVVQRTSCKEVVSVQCASVPPCPVIYSLHHTPTPTPLAWRLHPLSFALRRAEPPSSPPPRMNTTYQHRP